MEATMYNREEETNSKCDGSDLQGKKVEIKVLYEIGIRSKVFEVARKFSTRSLTTLCTQSH